MGYSGKLKEKIEAQSLRKKGFSYREICKKIKVSKSTVSLWCRNIKLGKSQMKRLYWNWRTGSLKGNIIGAKKLQKRKEQEIESLTKEGVKEIGSIEKRDFFIAGVALYYAEGSKTDGDVSFSNSDPALINFMMKWLKYFCQITLDKFRAHLYIHQELHESEAKKYWSNLTKIPLVHFYKSYIAKVKKKRLHKNIHHYGVLKIRVSNRKIHRKIRGWMEGLIKIKY